MGNIIFLIIPSGGEALIIFLAILLLFGGKKIPELMRGLGKGMREFNQAKANLQQSLQEGMREAEKAEAEKKRLAAERARNELKSEG